MVVSFSSVLAHHRPEGSRWSTAISQSPSSVMRYQSCALNDIISETTRPSALIFEIKHCLVDLYQVCSIGGL